MPERKMYLSWDDVPDNFKTKTQLKELGLKPAGKALAYKKAVEHPSLKYYELFDVAETVEIRKRKIKPLEITDENIAAALYIVNKSAKKSRDTKKWNYQWKQHGVVSAAKTRENKLYQLKDKVMEELIRQGMASVEGIHSQIICYDHKTQPKQRHVNADEYYDDESYDDYDDFSEDEEELETEIAEKRYRLVLIKFCGYQFHVPYDLFKGEKENLPELGTIEEVISAESKIESPMGFNQAVDLLERFVSSKGYPRAI